MTTTLPPFPAFDITQDQGALGLRWKKYIDRFRNLIVALNIADKKRQRALLLHYAGEDVNDIFETLANTTASGEENPLEKAIDALTAYFTPKKNVAYKEYQFRQAKQEQGEKIMAYYTRLKHLSQTCDFADADREIKTQIIQHCTSTKLRRKALSTPDITLQTLLDYEKTLELTETQVSALENQGTEEVNNLKKHVGNQWKLGMETKSPERIRGTEDRPCRARAIRNADIAADHTHMTAARQAVQHITGNAATVASLGISSPSVEA